MAQPATKKRRTGVDPDGTQITDSRFANIQSDPRYRLPGRKQKVKVDKRFAKALQDEDFSRRAKVDRYGRPLEADSERKRLKRKYSFEEDENSESDEADDDDEVQAELERVTDARDVLREGRDVSSSEDESSSGEDSEEEEEEGLGAVDEGGIAAHDRDVPMGEVTSRMAVVNLDWDNIRAADLMAVFQSFIPATGRLLKVAIYPSEFGKERIEREEMEGPPKEIFAKREDDELSGSESDEEDDEDIKNSIIKPDDGSDFDSTALRQYQLERLRYYYAVLTFSDLKTAKAIYDAVDGTEYLSTANFFDLRFVPDDTDFSDDTPKEECERIPASYKPNEFVTDALQHSKVKLTWDADDTTRKEAQARAFRNGRKEIDENDLKAYLGSDSDSEEDVDVAESKSTDGLSKKDAERQRMRALLGLAAEPEQKTSKDKKKQPLGNIQITFSSGLSGQVAPADGSDEDAIASKPKKKRSVFENSPEPDETTAEKYVRKEKERKQRRKEKMKAGRTTTTEEEHPVEDATISENDEDEDQGFDDPFFAEPTNDTKSTHKQRKAERLQRRAEREAEEAANAQQRAALEKLMADDDDDDDKDNQDSTSKPTKRGRTVRHFDMNEIEKAEKALAKKQQKKINRHAKNKNKSREAEHEAVLAADDFTIDTHDPRFARLYENHEFAIDPTNPRFKGTKGMMAVLQEGRKRKEKTSGGVVAGEDDETGPRTKGSGGKGTMMAGDSEVMGLVEKIRKRNK